MLSHLGPGSHFIAQTMRLGRSQSKGQQKGKCYVPSYARYETDVNISASLAKQQDDAMMEALHADDDGNERLRNQSNNSDEDDAFITKQRSVERTILTIGTTARRRATGHSSSPGTRNTTSGTPYVARPPLKTKGWIPKSARKPIFDVPVATRIVSAARSLVGL